MSARPSTLILLLAALAAGGCTVLGDGFDDPKGELVLVAEPRELCASGRVHLFGSARNTGELEVRNSTAVADVFGPDGLVGRFSAPVSSSVESVEVVGPDGLPVSVDIVNDTIEVDQTGTFSIETTAPCGSVSRVQYSFDFTVAVFEDI